MLKIVTPDVWAAAEAAGVMPLEGVDARDGYVHLSAPHQAAETLALHFAGPAEVVLAAFDAADLGAALKWEASRGGALFPHLHGPLDPARAVRVWRLVRGADGAFALPDDLA